MTPARRSRFYFLPPVLNAAVLVLHTTLMYRAALKHTGGNISFPVDDTFIHLALAKHLTLDGTYGIAAGQFAATSSSVGWPFLLAASMKIAGVGVSLPLWLTGAFGILFAFVVDRAARALVPGIGGFARFIVGLAAILSAPLSTVIVLGMEHAPHVVAHVAFVSAVSQWLASSEEKKASRTLLQCALLAAFVSFWRYEGAFPVSIAAGLALLRGRFRGAAVLLGAGALPGVAFGLWSKARGSLFLPIPVVLKGRHFDRYHLSDIFGIDLMDRFGVEAAILVVTLTCVLLVVVLTRKSTFWTPLTLALFITVAVIVLHLQFASLGWFYRYEAYLLGSGAGFAAMGIVAVVRRNRGVIRMVRKMPVRFFLGLLGVALLAMPLRKRAVQANDDTPTACANIYNQQVQSARFLSGFDTPVAINDIGAVAWVGEEPIVDLVGLASLEVARAKDLRLEQQIPVAELARFTSKTRVAIIYDDWFKNGVPSRWLPVGRWRIPNNKSCASPVVSIYATDPESYPEVIQKLRAFGPRMPEDVAQYGRYTMHPLEPNRLEVGDQIVIASDLRELAGGYTIAEDGAILLPGIRSERATLAGYTVEEARDRLVKRLLEVPAGNPGDVNIHAARVERITRSVTTPIMQVVGSVPRAVAMPVVPVADAVTAAGGTQEDAARAWAWRETPDGFRKIAHTDLGDVLVSGDILVVPNR